MNQLLLDYYRIPEDLLTSSIFTDDCASAGTGFFQIGANTIAYGRCRSGVAANVEGSGQFNTLKDHHRNGAAQLPFSFAEVIDNLRLERYRQTMIPRKERFSTSEPIRNLYYLIRRCLPVSVRRHLQRSYFSGWEKIPFPAWPVDFTVDTLHEELLRLSMEASGVRSVPFIWFWPEGAPNCLIMTHDVETSAGRDFTSQLMDLDDSYGIKGSFQVIPEKRYQVSDEYISNIRRRGFEFNIHDLNHDGHLYREREEFMRRAARINAYVRRYDARGFRAGAMYRNLDWYDAFELSYDMSVPNVAHLEPLRGGCCTVMPYFVGKILELPLTEVQDYSIFHILNDYSIDLWKQQTELIRARNGLMSFITHPDYLIERRARRVYESLLHYLRQMIDREKIWNALPGEVDQWWRARNQMKLIYKDGNWEIEGPQRERARIAYASTENGKIAFALPAEGRQARNPLEKEKS